MNQEVKYCVFCVLVVCKFERKQRMDQQVSKKTINGIRGVRNEKHLEVGVMG